MTKRSLALFFLVLMATPAAAHTGVGTTSGLIAGLAHPLSGLDHVLAMIAIGLWASILGGRCLWLVPAAFMTVMMVGGALGSAGVPLPFGEALIAASIIGLGGLIACDVRLPTAAAMAIAGFFALAHGHAHGAEMPATADGLEYGLGFLIATAALHLAGIGIGIAVHKAAHARILPWIGAAVAAAGIAIGVSG